MTRKRATPTGVTVEERLEQFCEECAKRVRTRAEEFVSELRGQLETEKAELQDAFRQVDASPNKNVRPTTFNVILVGSGGHYDKHEFTLKPRKAACMVGRSTGKRFLNAGVSLPQDPEVSTTHGKVDFKDGSVGFTDVGSTNGTSINGTLVEEMERIPIKSGDVIRIGATDFTVRVVEA